MSGTNFVFSVVNLLLVDKFGRRILLCISTLGMSICMLIAVIAFRWIPIDTSTLTLEEGADVGWAGILVLVTIIFYVAFYSSGVATIAWIGTELIPLEVRALGTMVNTVTCWSTNIIIASTFLSMMKGMTPSGAFGFYCGICFFGWVFIVICYPGKSHSNCLVLGFDGDEEGLKLTQLTRRREGDAARDNPRRVPSWIWQKVQQAMAARAQARKEGSAAKLWTLRYTYQKEKTRQPFITLKSKSEENMYYSMLCT